MPRTYMAPTPGASITINGETYKASKKGIVAVPDSADHAEMLSHGFKYQTEPLPADGADGGEQTPEQVIAAAAAAAAGSQSAT
jgi:hypothetical protein